MDRVGTRGSGGERSVDREESRGVRLRALVMVNEGQRRPVDEQLDG